MKKRNGIVKLFIMFILLISIVIACYAVSININDDEYIVDDAGNKLTVDEVSHASNYFTFDPNEVVGKRAEIGVDAAANRTRV